MATRRRGFSTQAPREITLVAAIVLWLAGVLDQVVHAVHFPSNYGLWALVLAGLLLILGSLVDGI